jgi:CRP/FNR family transcriptional regulator, cyclic AMP receptor protein
MHSKLQGSVSEDVHLLVKIQALSWLPQNEASQLVREFPPENFARNDVIYDGSTSSKRRIFILLSGRVNLMSYSKHNGGNIIAMIPPGIIHVIPALIAPVTNTYQYKAATNCRTIDIPLDKFIEIAFGLKLTDNRHFFEFCSSFFGYSPDLFIRYPSFLGLDLLTRVGIAVLELAENFGVRSPRGVIVPQLISHDDLADLVGASRPRVTSAVASLEQQQIIGREGRHIIVDTSGLRDFIALHA